MEYFLEGSAQLWNFSFKEVPYNGIFPSWKCSIKASVDDKDHECMSQIFAVSFLGAL